MSQVAGEEERGLGAWDWGLGDEGLPAAGGYSRAQDDSLGRPADSGSTAQLQIPAQLLWVLQRGDP